MAKNPTPSGVSHAIEHPRLGITLGLSGLVGIGIPLLDHKSTYLGFFLCWLSALAICVIYYKEWKFGFSKLKPRAGYIKVADRRPMAMDAWAAPFVVLIYFCSPLFISYTSNISPRGSVVAWGPAGDFTYTPGADRSVIGTKACRIIVDGKVIQEAIGNEYKLVGACFHATHGVDLKDEPISKSAYYDIEQTLTAIIIPWSNTYVEELVNGASPTIYELLAVPASKTGQKFNTVRQALDIGAKRFAENSGPP